MDLDVKKFDNKIIITDVNGMNNLLLIRKKKPFLNFKIIDVKEVINKLTYEYDYRSLLCVHRLGYSYHNAKEIIENLRFLKENVSLKVDDLIAIKKTLDQENLLQYNHDYELLLKSRPVMIFLPYDDIIINRLLTERNIPYEYYFYQKQNLLTCYEFSNINDEIRFLFENIYSLIKNNIPLSKIKIVINNNDYKKYLFKYQSLYQLKLLNLNSISYNLCEDYRIFKSILNTTLFDQAFEFIKDKVDDYCPLEKLLSKYIEVKDYVLESELEDFFDFVAEEIIVEDSHHGNEIEIININDVRDDDYNFILGFCLNSYPSVSNDDDYLSDKEKKQLKMMTSLQKQDIEEKKISSKLLSLKHGYLSYSKKIDKNVFYPSLLLDKLQINIVDNYQFQDVVYSKKHFEVMMAKIFDDARNFSVFDKYYCSCKKEDIAYLEYDHRFKPLSNYHYENIKLSYTQINSFYECQFKYYLNYILKADEFTTSIYSLLGTFTHILMEYTSKGIAFDFDQILKEQDFPPREKTLIEVLKDQIMLAVDNLKELLKKSDLNQTLAEEDDYKYVIDENSTLTGKIDLVLYDQNHFAIIDYKTGDDDFKKNIVKYGLSLQLPIYALLSQDSNFVLSDKKLCGLYINNVLSNDYYLNDYDYLLLKGISINQEGGNKIKTEFIKTKNKKLPTVDMLEFKELMDVCIDKLKAASKAIIEGEFKINPKIISKNNISCKYCRFNDICYHDYHDNVYLKEEEDEVHRSSD